MKKPNKIFRIRLLMIISHLLLTVFVLQWLVSRYSLEKISLKKELNREFIASEEKMLDSLLIVKVVDPFLQSKAKSGFNMYFVGDSEKVNVNKRNWIKKSNQKDTLVVSSFGSLGHRSSTINIKIDRNSRDTFVEVNNMRNKPIITEDSLKSANFRDKFLVQSIKVLSNRVPDKNGNTKSIVMSLSTGFDSTILKKEFEKRILVNNFKLEWKKQDSAQIANSDLYFGSNMLENSLGVEVSHYDFYLFKKIFPQILFGFILVLLTGAAFVISFISLKKQIQLNLIRNDFISNISHELKTPISTVKVALEALQNYNIKNEPLQADEYIRIAQMEMNRLDLLVQKVLTSSVYEQTKELMQFEKVNLKDLVNEVLKSMQIRINQANARVSLESIDEETFIFADKMHLQGVLINLIDNSLKYVDATPIIDIKISKDSDHVLISVADNGIGIPNEYISKLFDKFFRVPTENKHNVKGYGLGLSYAAMVMKQHKGTINVENRKDGGCIFTLTFPKIQL